MNSFQDIDIIRFGHNDWPKVTTIGQKSQPLARATTIGQKSPRMARVTTNGQKSPSLAKSHHEWPESSVGVSCLKFDCPDSRLRSLADRYDININRESRTARRLWHQTELQNKSWGGPKAETHPAIPLVRPILGGLSRVWSDTRLLQAQVLAVGTVPVESFYWNLWPQFRNIKGDLSVSSLRESSAHDLIIWP